jgi:hypothetical protein
MQSIWKSAAAAADQARTLARERLARRGRPPQPTAEPSAAVAIVIRYSVLVATPGHWRIAQRGSFADYRAALFADDRLDNRLALFRRFALPSLAAQTLPMQRGLRGLVILTSTELPERHLDALRRAIASHDWAEIVAVPPDAGDWPEPQPAPVFASVRLDDDDAVSRDYLARLSAYVRRDCVGKAVTFPHGFYVRSDGDTDRLLFRREWKPKLAVGLAYIVGPDSPFRSVYGLGRHRKVDRVAPVIIDPYGPAYLKMAHAGQDKRFVDFAPQANITEALVRSFIEFGPPPGRGD